MIRINYRFHCTLGASHICSVIKECARFEMLKKNSYTHHISMSKNVYCIIVLHLEDVYNFFSNDTSQIND